MPRRRQVEQPPELKDDLAFPPPYSEQAKYLELAARFLERDERHNARKVVSTDTGMHPHNGKWKKDC
jgi:hypothetical protein